MEANEKLEHLELLNTVFLKKKEKNKSFSLRAFAKKLETSPGTLSGILNGKRSLTLDRAIMWQEKLNLPTEVSERFINSVKNDQYKRLNTTEREFKKVREKYDFHLIKLDHFELIDKWYHIAILNVIELDHFESNSQWIANYLNLDEDDVQQAIARLKRLNLIEEKEDRIVRIKEHIETPSDLPSQAIRTYHAQNIDRAKRCLEDTDISQRDITSITMPISKKKLAEAKKKISVFRKELSDFLQGEERDDVYTLNIQLFPQGSRK